MVEWFKDHVIAGSSVYSIPNGVTAEELKTNTQYTAVEIAVISSCGAFVTSDFFSISENFGDDVYAFFPVSKLPEIIGKIDTCNNRNIIMRRKERIVF